MIYPYARAVNPLQKFTQGSNGGRLARGGVRMIQFCSRPPDVTFVAGTPFPQLPKGVMIQTGNRMIRNVKVAHTQIFET